MTILHQLRLPGFHPHVDLVTGQPRSDQQDLLLTWCWPAAHSRCKNLRVESNSDWQWTIVAWMKSGWGECCPTRWNPKQARVKGCQMTHNHLYCRWVLLDPSGSREQFAFNCRGMSTPGTDRPGVETQPYHCNCVCCRLKQSETICIQLQELLWLVISCALARKQLTGPRSSRSQGQSSKSFSIFWVE